MDPVLESIFLGLFVNGLSSLIGNTGKKFLSSFLKSKSLNSIVSENEIDQIEITLSKESGKVDMKSICEFIESIEVESIVRQIYALEIEQKNYNVNAVKKEFNLLFSRYFEMDEENTKYLSSMLFQALFLGCREICSRARLRRKLKNEEMSPLLEFNILRDQIATIQKNIELLSTNNKLNIKEIHEFIEDYRRSVEKRYELIRSITYGTQSRVPFDDIYVYPHLVKVPKRPRQSRLDIDGLRTSNSKCVVENELISLDKFLSNTYRAVILGDPGAGKTTLAKKICYDLTNRHSERLFFKRKVTPILVTLREYQTQNIEANVSIVDYITSESNSNYQIPAPNGAFEYLLLNGHILLVFDGLDELLETSSREKIIDEIESFCTHYPSVPVLVTSRKIGYDQAPLDIKIFEKFELASFDYDQVQEYVYKWFALDPDLTEKEKINRANSFLEESEIVDDIRSNCLMLSLMCSIYKEENYIPENRPQIYQKCAEMLFERWDKHRGITPKLHVPKSKIKPLLAFLAYSIFTCELFQEGINESKLIAKSSEYLLDTIYEDIDEAELAAKDFINFCKGRAWILTDVGSTKRGEGIYQFTHRTFLEYFTADWIVRKNNLEEISELLFDNICKGEWDVVAQLVLQIKCENSEEGEELLVKLIQCAENEKISAKLNLLSFSARCLQFIVPNPKITREITNACFKFTIDNGINLIEQINLKKVGTELQNYELGDLSYIFDAFLARKSYIYDPLDLIRSLKAARIENLNTVGDTLKELLYTNLLDPDENKSYLAAELCLLIGVCIEDLESPYIDNGKFWTHWSDELLDQVYKPDMAVFSRNRNISNELYFCNRISLNDLIKFHGLSSIFCSSSNLMVPMATNLGIALQLINEFLCGAPNYSELKKIGSLFLSVSIPIRLDKIFKEYHFLCRLNPKNDLFECKRIDICFNEDNDWFFGIFCLFACYYELNYKEINLEKISNCHLDKSNNPLTILQKIMISRLERIICPKNYKSKTTTLEKEIQEIYLSDKQKSIILDWVLGNTHFLEPISVNTNPN